ncbi:MAG TPA: protein kinase, partial [Rhodanobacteraceae bacterium]|nr:protein kinase [Rhodanobacteraceae bacterium]
MSRERIRELFSQAIDVPEERRAEWLEAQCEGDEELRATVEQLLRADAKAQDFLERAPASIADAAVAAAARSAPKSFGVYRVLRSIGEGGMGEVWLAERGDGEFEQRVAVKRLTYPTPGLLQRFRQERQILARLEHPGIARLIDGGLDANGIPYLAMEYVDGVPITEYARKHGLDVAACLRLFVRVCEAVQYAHQSLVVHRDLKPSNIFVAADGAPYLAMEYVEGVTITEFARSRALDVPAVLRLMLRVCEAVQYAHQNLVVHRDLKPSNIFVTADGSPKLL